MPLKVKCRCGTVLTVPTQRIGKSVRCPSCGATVVIRPPEQRQRPQTPRQDKPKPGASAAEKDARPENLAAPQPDAKRQTKPDSPTRPQSSPTRPKDEGKATPDSRRQDQEKSAEPTRKKSGSKPAPPADRTTPNRTQPKQSKENESRKEETEKTAKEQLPDEVDSAQNKQAGQTPTDIDKPAKAADVEDGKSAASDEAKPDDIAPKEKPVETKSKLSEQAETKAKERRDEPEPGRRKEQEPEKREPETNKAETKKPEEKTPEKQKPEIKEPEEKKRDESHAASTAKKVPPALKRATTTTKEDTGPKPATQRPSEKPKPSRDKLPTTDSDAKKESHPPPLKSKPSPAQSQPAARSSDATQGKTKTPPLRHPVSKPATGSKPRPEKTSLKQKFLLKRRQRASEKATAATDEQPPARGVEHSAAKRWSAYYFAIGVIFVALITMAPAFYEGFQAFRLDPPRPMARWAYAAVVVGLVQIAYAFYLIQLPDWGSVWVVAILSLATTTMYAALASAVVLGGQNSNLLESLQLNFVARNKAMLWCTIMLTLSAVLTYFGGRLGIRWHKSFATAYPTTTSPSSS